MFLLAPSIVGKPCSRDKSSRKIVYYLTRRRERHTVNWLVSLVDSCPTLLFSSFSFFSFFFFFEKSIRNNEDAWRGSLLIPTGSPLFWQDLSALLTSPAMRIYDLLFSVGHWPITASLWLSRSTTYAFRWDRRFVVRKSRVWVSSSAPLLSIRDYLFIFSLLFATLGLIAIDVDMNMAGNQPRCDSWEICREPRDYSTEAEINEIVMKNTPL